jgi:AcrR family transcriptional regulator
MGKGLSKTAVIDEAVKIIETKGYTAFSMRELAENLNVKTASLYNHVKGMDEIHTEVGLRAIQIFRQAQLDAITEKKGESAIREVAQAYRTFAKKHPELYKVIMSLRMVGDEVLDEASPHIVDPIVHALSFFSMKEEQIRHWQRILRSIMHGFIAQEEAGFFRVHPGSSDDSYQLAIQCFLDGLHLYLERGREDGTAAK